MPIFTREHQLCCECKYFRQIEKSWTALCTNGPEYVCEKKQYCCFPEYNGKKNCKYFVDIMEE